MNRVIVAIDNSAAARPVLKMGQAVAPVLGSEIDVLHVVENGNETARATAEVAGLELRTLRGDPAEQLERQLVEEDITALVLGTRGRTGSPRPAGHLALTLASRTEKPVVVVPPDARPPEELRRVLVAMEGSPGKARALERTIQISATAALELTVVHVDEEIPRFTDQVQHETGAYAQEFLARFVIGAPRAELEVRIGDAATEVLGVVEKLQPDLLAIGWPHTSDPGRGAVAREILARCHVPILLVAVT